MNTNHAKLITRLDLIKQQQMEITRLHDAQGEQIKAEIIDMESAVRRLALVHVSPPPPWTG